jgi:hypothetical protein
MILIEKRERVQPVLVSKACTCMPGGTALVLRSVMAGHPPRLIYDCPVCKHPYYLDKEAVTIEYEKLDGGV